MMSTMVMVAVCLLVVVVSCQAGSVGGYTQARADGSNKSLVSSTGLRDVPQHSDTMTIPNCNRNRAVFVGGPVPTRPASVVVTSGGRAHILDFTRNITVDLGQCLKQPVTVNGRIVRTQPINDTITILAVHKFTGQDTQHIAVKGIQVSELSGDSISGRVCGVFDGYKSLKGYRLICVNPSDVFDPCALVTPVHGSSWGKVGFDNNGTMYVGVRVGQSNYIKAYSKAGRFLYTIDTGGSSAFRASITVVSDTGTIYMAVSGQISAWRTSDGLSLFNTRIPDGQPAVSITNTGQLIVSGKTGADSFSVSCLNARTGASVWTWLAPRQTGDQMSVATTTMDGMIYVLGVELYAIDSASGETVWSKPYHPQARSRPSDTQPAVGSEVDLFVHALDCFVVRFYK